MKRFLIALCVAVAPVAILWLTGEDIFRRSPNVGGAVGIGLTLGVTVYCVLGLLERHD